MEAKYPKIALQSDNELTFVFEEEITYAIAEGNYTQVFLTNNRSVKVLRKLKEVYQLLSGENFIRIHRSHLINLEHIVCMKKGDTVEMRNGSLLSISRNRKANFIEKFTRI